MTKFLTQKDIQLSDLHERRLRLWDALEPLEQELCKVENEISRLEGDK